MLDFVTLAMLIVVVVLTISIYAARFKKKFSLHRHIQIGTALILVLALVAFEVDVRFLTKWRQLAEVSPFYESGIVDWSLAIHLCFAIPTPIIWGAVIWLALRKFKTGYSQASFNRIHRISGRIAVAFMYLTAITGWIFYYVAFVA